LKDGIVELKHINISNISVLFQYDHIQMFLFFILNDIGYIGYIILLMGRICSWFNQMVLVFTKIRLLWLGYF